MRFHHKGGRGRRTFGSAAPAARGRMPRQPMPRDRVVTAVVVIFGTLLLEIVALTVGGGFALDQLAGVAFLVWAGRHFVAMQRWATRQRRRRAAASLPTTWWELAKGWVRFRRTLWDLRPQWAAGCYEHGIRTAERRGSITPQLYRIDTNVDFDVQAVVAPGRLAIREGVDKIAGARGDLATTCGVMGLRVKPNHVGDEAVLTFLKTEPLRRYLHVSQLPLADDGRAAFGVTESGVASLDMNKSTLIAAAQGAGKSSVVWTILADLLRRREYVDLYVLDPKGGQEWGWLLRLATIVDCRIRIVEFAKNETEGRPMIERALKRLQERQGIAGHVDMDDWSKPPVRQMRPSAENPRIVILIDELLHCRTRILPDSPTKPSPLVQFISISRSACGAVIACTQDPNKETLPGPTRDLFGQRICMRTSSPSMTGVILNPDAEGSGAKASKIPESMPGLGYLFDADSGYYLKFRAAHVPDADITNHIQYGRPVPGMPVPSLDDRSGTPERDCGVYVLFTVDSECVYVGISFDPLDRFKAHAKRDFWPLVDQSKTKIVWCGSEAQARKLEKRLTAKYAPRFNDQNNHDNPLRGVPIAEFPAPPKRVPAWRQPADPTWAALDGFGIASSPKSPDLDGELADLVDGQVR